MVLLTRTISTHSTPSRLIHVPVEKLNSKRKWNSCPFCAWSTWVHLICVGVKEATHGCFGNVDGDDPKKHTQHHSQKFNLIGNSMSFVAKPLLFLYSTRPIANRFINPTASKSEFMRHAHRVYSYHQLSNHGPMLRQWLYINQLLSLYYQGPKCR